MLWNGDYCFKSIRRKGKDLLLLHELQIHKIFKEMRAKMKNVDSVMEGVLCWREMETLQPEFKFEPSE